jgi:RNA polymerase sigma-70 factor, ECF subfamily
VVASLTRRFGDLDIAEEATAEAFATAGAWLTTTAKHTAETAYLTPRRDELG